MTGIILMSSVAAMISCNPSRKTTCYVEPMDSTLNNDTIKTSCYEAVAPADTQINEVTPEEDIPDNQIMCYKRVSPEEDNNHKPSN